MPDTRHLTPLLRALALAALTIPSFLFPVPSPAQTPTYHVGRAPSAEEIRAWDISISPDGKELPPGSGTAQQGAPIYAQKCAYCHGPTGKEGPSLPGAAKLWPFSSASPGYIAPSLVGPRAGAVSSPFATTLWDYTRRAMPPKAEGSLSADEVYALTALVLSWNGIIQENDVMDAKSLPKVEMPNRSRTVYANVR